jgi:hypothetical protein
MVDIMVRSRTPCSLQRRRGAWSVMHVQAERDFAFFLQMSDGKPLTEFEFISLNKDYNKKIRQVLSSKEQLEGQSQMMLAFEIEVRSSSCFSRSFMV